MIGILVEQEVPVSMDLFQRRALHRQTSSSRLLKILRLYNIIMESCQTNAGNCLIGLRRTAHVRSRLFGYHWGGKGRDGQLSSYVAVE